MRRISISASTNKQIENHGHEALRQAYRIFQSGTPIDEIAAIMKITMRQASLAVEAGKELIMYEDNIKRANEARKTLQEARDAAKREHQRKQIEARADERANFDKMNKMLGESEVDLPLARVFDSIHNMYKRAWDHMDEFHVSLHCDPSYTMRVCGDSFYHGAAIAWCGRLMATRQWECTSVAVAQEILESISKELEEFIIHKAKYPPSSTSVVSNLAEIEESRVASNIHEMIRYAQNGMRRRAEKEATDHG